MASQEHLRELFEPIRQHLEAEAVTFDQGMADVSKLAEINPQAAFALTSHLTSIMTENHVVKTDSPDFNRHYAEAYYRTFFDPITAAQFGTNYFNGDFLKLHEFVCAFTTNQAMGGALDDSTRH